MLYVTNYTFKPGMDKEDMKGVLDTFAAVGNAPGTIAHYVWTDGRGGTVIVDTDDVAATYRNLLNYTEWMEFDQRGASTVEQAVAQAMDYAGVAGGTGLYARAPLAGVAGECSGIGCLGPRLTDSEDRVGVDRVHREGGGWGQRSGVFESLCVAVRPRTGRTSGPAHDRPPTRPARTRDTPTGRQRRRPPAVPRLRRRGRHRPAAQGGARALPSAARGISGSRTPRAGATGRSSPGAHRRAIVRSVHAVSEARRPPRLLRPTP